MSVAASIDPTTIVAQIAKGQQRNFPQGSNVQHDIQETTPDMSKLSNAPQEWDLATQLQTDQALLSSRGLAPFKSLSLSYDHLSVRGTGGVDNVEYGMSMGTFLAPWMSRRYRQKAAQIAAARHEDGVEDDTDMSWKQGSSTPRRGEAGLRKGEHYLLNEFSGLVKAGEMMLVVGRPGSGCSTFLKVLSGHRSGYAGVDGTVRYGSIEAGKGMRPYKGSVIFNSEEDVHDANLLVGRTLDFALRMSTPAANARLPNENGGPAMRRKEYQDKSKRELMKMFGLEHAHDTKVGDQYVRGVSGGEKKRVSIAEVLTTKASVQMWDNATRGLDADTAFRFVKTLRTLTDIEHNTTVVSLYQAGNGIYNLFDKVTVIAEGQVIYYGPRAEAKGYFEDLGFVHPDGGNTADFLTAVTATNERKIRDGYQGEIPTSASDFASIYAKSDIARRMREELDQYLADEVPRHETAIATAVIQKQKDRWALKSWPQRVDYFTQVQAALIRDYQQRWGDQCLGETTAAFSGRAVLSKHKGFSMYRPSAVLVAQTIGDMPIYFVTIAVFTLIVYFMTGLKYDAGLFFTYLLFTYLTTLCTTALFRLIGYAFNTFNAASKASGFVLLALSMYAGYVIYTPLMHPWFSWIRWIDPFYYALESLMSNEVDGLALDCVSPQLAPYGGDYANYAQGCAIAGADPNSTVLSGTSWLNVALSFRKSHVWRNFGILVAFWLFFLFICAIMIEMVPAAGTTRSVLLYKRGGGGRYLKQAKRDAGQPRDEEDGPNQTHLYEKHGHSSDGSVVEDRVHAAQTVLTWKNLTYTVNANGKPRQLLDNIFGYCKAGTLTALMGSSGAGKTTLMDVLAARKTEGEIHGEILMNGKPLPVSFQRSTGYCEQVDVHLPQATVREALEFSALLRQPRSLSDKVSRYIGLPELTVEQRKRLTIGVELVSKPTLLFLDEPTSGLDGQSSYLIVSFLRKLAAAGQAVLCTIHQPSAALFARFDQLLLLKGGGRTVYSERMIDIVSGELSKGRDWAQVWLDSDECQERRKELQELEHESADVDNAVEGDHYEYASTNIAQLRLVTKRASIQLWRDTEYVLNKFALHVIAALLNGFWMIGDAYADLQSRIFTIFLFVFVAPGVIAQTQPKFIHNRDIFETREKKAKLYSWHAFCFAEIVAEIPYLLVCALLYFVCWYPVVGFSFKPSVAGPVYLQMTFYEFLYTGIGQFIAAYAPHEVFAALVNPLLIGILVMFCGVLVPYDQITAFWRYWLYYLNPFNYLIGGLVSRPIWDVAVRCADDEYAIFDPPQGMTCNQYMSGFLAEAPGYLNNPQATGECQYCIVKKGSDYLQALNLGTKSDGWRDIALTFLFVVSSYGLVFLLLKLRSKRSKKAQ
ncbi:hypothetical protein CI109_104950 [Kwoniella shandongensis]|uniref:ABC transporter domain-containing protein n=1 Tax=Kwoniella shandongensis TaxID=1734106 RepID=A0AAJ8LNR1_9TREE